MSTGKRTVSDEKLSAYLDGMLDDAQARSLEETLETDRHATRRLAAMIRNDRMLRHGFQTAARRPVPRAITELLETAPGAERTRRSGLAEWLSGWAGVPTPARFAGAMALVVAVGFGALIGFNQGPQSNAWPDASGTVQALPSASQEVSRFLDREPSGRPVALYGNARGMVDLSFEHADGGYCRQYRVTLADYAASYAGIACRVERRWQEVLVKRIDGSLVDESGLFRAASGRASPVIDDYILDNISGDILVGAAEAALIEHGWSEP